MTYRAGLSGFGASDRDAHITCDGDRCGIVASPGPVSRGGFPSKWFLDGKAPPGWKLARVEEPFSRKDYCPKCKAQVSK